MKEQMNKQTLVEHENAANNLLETTAGTQVHSAIHQNVFFFFLLFNFLSILLSFTFVIFFFNIPLSTYMLLLNMQQTLFNENVVISIESLTFLHTNQNAQKCISTIILFSLK
jgi:hypothetical protein